MVEYAEFLSASLTLTSATYVETVINVPTPRLGGGYGRYGRGRTATAMVIHSIEWDIPFDAEWDDAAGNRVELQLTKQSKAAICSLTDGDLIGKVSQTANGIGSLQVCWYPLKTEFKIPVLVAGQKLFLGGIAPATTTPACTIRILYSMREVMESDLVRSQIV